MWGNRTGWIISALIIVTAIVAVMSLHSAGEISPLSQQFLANRDMNLAVLELPISPESIVPMNDPQDATEFYHEAIQSAVDNPKLYDDYMGAPPPPKGVDLLLKATHCAHGDVLKFDMPILAAYQLTPELAPIAATSEINMAALKCAVRLRNAKKLDDCNRYLEAIFALGAKMAAERISYPELDAGLATMTLAAEAMRINAHSAKDADREAQLAKFLASLGEFRKTRLTFLHTITKNVDSTITAQHAGDVLLLASNKCKEPMWRVEAMLELGSMRFSIGENGYASDQRMAKKVVTEAANDPANPPAVQNAAKAARDLTVVDWRIHQ